MVPTVTNDNQTQNSIESTTQNEKNPFSFFSTDWKYNVVDKVDTPSLYSRRAIYFFTVFCSVFFGGTLMFLNLRKLKSKQGQIVVAVYSILYGVISLAILGQFERNTMITMLVSMIGSFALYNYFWEKYIGRDTEYRAKSIWKPLTIALLILVLFMIVVVTNIEAFK
jgi:FtsH-binding integral membrane protein